MASQILDLPSSILEQMPVATAPPGQQSNLIDPVDKGDVLISVATVFFALGLTAFSIRLYAKAYIIRKLYWDDRKTNLHSRKLLREYSMVWLTVTTVTLTLGLVLPYLRLRTKTC